MNHSDVSALASELAELTCPHLAWSDRRVIALELGAGECDLAIDDMVRGAVHSPCRLPPEMIARLRIWLDGTDLTACTDKTQLRGYVNQLRCA